MVCCPRISNLRAPAIAWGYSPCLLKNSCGVQSTTEKIEKSTARAEPLPQPTAGKGWVGWASQKAKFTRVSLRNNHKVAAPLQPLFGKVSSRNVVFPSLAFSESPTSTHIQLLITSLTTKLTVQKVQAMVYCPRISKSRGPAISWGYSPSLLKISCGVQSTTEKIEKSTARAELLPQPTDVKRVGGTGEPKSELHECFTSKQP